MKTMNPHRLTLILRVAFVIVLLASFYGAVSSDLTRASSPAKTPGDVPAGKADAMIDLGSVDGVKTVTPWDHRYAASST
jgi:hypothetical protein